MISILFSKALYLWFQLQIVIIGNNDELSSHHGNHASLRPICNNNVVLVSWCHHSTAMTYGTNFIPGVCILGKTYVPCSRNIHYIHIWIWCKISSKIWHPKVSQEALDPLLNIEANDKLDRMKVPDDADYWGFSGAVILLIIQKRKWVGAHSHFW